MAGVCIAETSTPPCERLSLLSLRIPVDAWRADAREGRAWPPADLTQLRLRVQLLGPGELRLFDSLTTPPSSPAMSGVLDSLQAGGG